MFTKVGLFFGKNLLLGHFTQFYNQHQIWYGGSWYMLVYNLEVPFDSILFDSPVRGSETQKLLRFLVFRLTLLLW